MERISSLVVRITTAVGVLLPARCYLPGKPGFYKDLTSPFTVGTDCVRDLLRDLLIGIADRIGSYRPLNRTTKK